MNEKYTVAVEIGSSKIIAAIGKSRGDGMLQVVAVEQETDVDAIRYGIIQNLEDTYSCLSRLFGRLEQRSGIAPRKIKGVVVGLAGRSLRNIPTEVNLNLPEDTEITDDMLARLQDQALHVSVDSSLEVIDAVPRKYKVGNIETESPKGMVGNRIDAVFDLIVCRPELKRNIKRVIADKMNLNVEGFVVTAMATGHLILTPDEKRLGCMLVDMGAQTTTVSIYKDGGLRYFATLPMGGRNITHDLTSLGVIEARAEEIKKTSGDAMAAENAGNLIVGGLKFSDISNLIVARSEEIVANIVEQISYAGLKESDLNGGIICIGGASRLKGIMELLGHECHLPVRSGKLPDYVRLEAAKGFHGELIEVVSVLYAGATLSDHECLVLPELKEGPTGVLPLYSDEQEEPKEKEQPRSGARKKFMETLGRKISNIFGNPDDDSELI